MDQSQMDFDIGADKLCEECGIFGMYDFDRNGVAPMTYYGLFALRHRGQGSCGITVSDTQGSRRKVGIREGMDLCNEVLTTEILEQAHGNIGIGYVWYSTVGSSTRRNAQPLVFNYVKSTLALAYNENLVNAPRLCHELRYTGAVFQIIVDSKVTAYHITRARVDTPSAKSAVPLVMKKLGGVYSLVIMSSRKLIRTRDPFGFKPLCIGKRNNAYILAPETCTLDTIGVGFVRNVEFGEIVTIIEDGIMSDRKMCPKDPARKARYIFEYIYPAEPDSVSDETSVYHARIQAGRFLATDAPMEADLVVGIPESGNGAVLGYSTESGVPYGTTFVKDSYVERTFIKLKQSSRESTARIKLNVFREAVAGKRMIMVGGSIVRGMTGVSIMNMFRDTGAIQVHVCISASPFLHPCYFSTDVPLEDQLIARGHAADKIRRTIGADSLSFLQTECLHEMAAGEPVCMAYSNDIYPIEPPSTDIRGTYKK